MARSTAARFQRLRNGKAAKRAGDRESYSHPRSFKMALPHALHCSGNPIPRAELHVEWDD